MLFERLHWEAKIILALHVGLSSLHWLFDCFYVNLVQMELIPSKPPPYAYVIFFICSLQKGSTFQLRDFTKP